MMETKTTILVDHNGIWRNGTDEITQEDILTYFKQHLHKVGENHYIIHTFQEKEEKARLQEVHNYCIHIVSSQRMFDHFILQTDAGEIWNCIAEDLYIDGEDGMVAVHPQRKIPARFTAHAMVQLAGEGKIKENGLQLKDIHLPFRSLPSF
jgi:hypothetical protein